MPPQQQQNPVQPQAAQPSPYDFILNDNQPPKSKFPFGEGSLKNKLFLIGGGFVALIIIIVLFSSILGSSGPDVSQRLVGIAQQQQEIIRLSKVATEKGRLANTQNLGASTIASLSSSQQQITSLLGKKAKLNEKTLGAKQDVRADQQLNEAALNNQFDPVFMQVYQTKMVEYQKELKATFDATKNTKTKEVLQSAFNGANTLIGSQ